MYPSTEFSVKQTPIPTCSPTGETCTFCSDCAFSSVCLAAGYDKGDVERLHELVEHNGPFSSGKYIFRTGDAFRSIYAVRSGMVKTVTVDADGREQVLGFYLPGEVVGLNGIYPGSHPCDAIALEETEFCRFSFSALSDLAMQAPSVQQHLFRLLSKELGAAIILAGDHTADERLAAFLVDLGERYALRGMSATSFRLSMSRSDIANYLRLAAETVSRVLGRFRTQGWLRTEGRYVEILDFDALLDQARCVLNR